MSFSFWYRKSRRFVVLRKVFVRESFDSGYRIYRVSAIGVYYGKNVPPVLGEAGKKRIFAG